MAGELKKLSALVVKLSTDINQMRSSAGAPAASPGLSVVMDPGRVINTQGILCPTKKGTGGREGGSKNRYYFVTPQLCATCNKTIHHLPSTCPKLPANKGKQAEFVKKKADEAEAALTGN